MGQNVTQKSTKQTLEMNNKNNNNPFVKNNHGNEIIKKFDENFKIYEKMSNHRSLSNLELVKMRQARRLLRPMKIKNKSQISLLSEYKEKEINISENLLLLPGNRLDTPKLRLPTKI